MRLVARALCACALALSARAHAIDFDFQVPADASDANVAAAMRDLAERILPVYHEDDQERYLANLSALQLVAGHYDAARGTREALRERRQESRDNKARADPGAVLLDGYAQARAIEAGEHVPLAQAFERVGGETLPRLGDLDAYGVTTWPGAPPDALEQALQQALDRARGRDHVDHGEALRLVWTYLALDLWRSVGPQLQTLGAADDARRYVLEDAPIKLAKGSLQANVIRPKNVAARLPALLEFPAAGSVGDAKASAAHGYAGVVAHARGKNVLQDSADARAVIAWIARQPWSDGRVGMFGRGDGALTVWAVAARKPRALRAIATRDATAPAKPVLSAKQFAAVTIPVLTLSAACGPADAGTLNYFRQHTRYRKHADHTLLLGACDSRAVLDESAATAVLDLRELRYQWFDHVFKGGPVPAVLQGRVNYEDPNTHEWRHQQSLAK